jgi:hypothetical protein
MTFAIFKLDPPTITLIKQADLGENVGLGEVKIAQPTCDKVALCLGFVRLAYLGKEPIDNGCLEASLCFQITNSRQMSITKPPFGITKTVN